MGEHTPVHGGDLVSASAQYHIGIKQWIDLSTGINPIAYPVKLEESSFQQLPYIRPEFIEASKNYYQCSNFLPVTGTQAAIQQIPKLLANFPVLLPKLGYQEHAKYWQEKAADITYYDSDTKDSMLSQVDHALAANPEQHLVIINPNNPTGVLLEKEHLLNWAKKLGKRAYLIIDEAFIDTHKEQSVLSENLAENIIVVRSFGKFFGLAGVRLGYCFAHKKILGKLQKKLGLWQINGPAQSLAIKALRDTKWHTQAITDIHSNKQFMQKLWEPLFGVEELGVKEFGIEGLGGKESLMNVIQTYHSCLFLSYKLPKAEAAPIRDHFAKLGILLRIILIPDDGSNSDKNTQALLRIGLIEQHNKAHVEHLKRGINSFIDTWAGN